MGFPVAFLMVLFSTAKTVQVSPQISLSQENAWTKGTLEPSLDFFFFNHDTHNPMPSEYSGRSFVRRVFTHADPLPRSLKKVEAPYKRIFLQRDNLYWCSTIIIPSFKRYPNEGIVRE